MVVSREEAIQALAEAFNNEDLPAMYFWTGYLVALAS